MARRRIASSDEDDDFELAEQSRDMEESSVEESEDEAVGSGAAGAAEAGPEPESEPEPQDDDTAGRRKTSVNYNEDDYFDEKLSGDELSGPEQQQQQTVKLKYKRKAESDDESFNGDDGDDDDDDPEHILSESEIEAERRRAERNFVVKDVSDDDDDDDEDGVIVARRRGRGRPRKSASRSASEAPRTRGRPRKTRRVDDASGDSDAAGREARELTLADELRELEDSPVRTPPHRKFNFRERKEVNYQLPPPLVVERPQDADAGAFFGGNTPKRGRRPGAGPLRRLFPTVGPFGGGDVTSVFGANVPGLTAVGGGDSDSSDDEIVPVGGAARRNSAALGTSGATSGTTNAFGKVEPRRKNALADNDPLGIDMDIDFSAVGGLDRYIDQLKEMVALPLLYPEVYQRFGITPPRGVLFHGPPGTGKTLMARALAASCSTETHKITFFMRKGADILSKWVGEAERQLRLLFEEARKQQPAIIFFDEIDGLAPVRSSKQEQIHASIVSTMLALMDGMDNRGQVIVIGATNRPDSVDPALRRPGRFDREFYFPLPDVAAREQILQIHTRQWDPPLDPAFVRKLAGLTKGYGGADLRALCTESALNSIQRRYPQIYQSQLKLQIDPRRITVVARDFMRALDKIVPSAARSVSSTSAPLPQHVAPLLQDTLAEITATLDRRVPRAPRVTALEESQYVDLTAHDADGGFRRQELLKGLSTARVFKPRVLVSGPAGSGQVYVGRALLNHLEGFHVQSLDLGSLYGDATRPPEAAIVQAFVEARRHTPAVVYIPDIDVWAHSLPEAARATLCGLLRSLEPSEQILLLCLAESDHHDADATLKAMFGFTSHIRLSNTFKEPQYEQFFEPLWTAFRLKPFEFGDLETRPRRTLPVLPPVAPADSGRGSGSGAAADPRAQRAQQKYDMRLKNTLKLRLSAMMELFKNRYKRFKKPTIDDNLLVHLFEPALLPADLEAPYRKDGDRILEVATGKRYYNMDLDIVEERLWNGFYSEPKQFLRDVELIYKDAVVTGDRDRILKASEMFANAQVGVDEIATPDFVAECKAMHAREIARQQAFIEAAGRAEAVAEESAEAVAEESAEAVAEESAETAAPPDDDVKPSLETPAAVAENGNAVDVGTTESAAISNGNGKPDGADDVVMQDVSGDTGAGAPAVPVEPAAPESDSEEITAAALEHLNRPLVYDAAALEKLQQTLVRNAAFNYTIENLEEINSQLMEIIWEHRLDWSRDAALQALSQRVDDYHKLYQDST